MKRKYMKPTLTLSTFAPTDYISACGTVKKEYLFECNAGEREKKYMVKDASGAIANISGVNVDGVKNAYYPCQTTHVAEEDSGFLQGYHIDDISTEVDEGIEVVIWTENGTDCHCTTLLDMNTWKVNHS